MILGIDNMAYGQYAGSCGAPLLISEVSETGSFKAVPSMCVSERYDSNVFYAPPTPGLRRDDFVTTVNPMLRLIHNGDYASGFLDVGGFSETYVKNPNLNYLGTNNTLFLNLNNSIKRLLPNASLSVTDTFSYTPLPPGFVSPAAGKSPSAPGNIQNVFAQGFMGLRTNNLTNSGTVSASYATTASTSLKASYNYAILRFLGTPSTQGQSLFNTTNHTGTVGGTARLSGLDILNIKYAHAQNDFTPSAPSSAPTSTFIIDSATIGWSRNLTSNLSTELEGGGIMVSGGTATHALNASLIMKFLNNSATINYSHSAFPSFAGTAGILIGDVFLLSAFQKIDRQWELVESASYAHTSGGSSLNALTYDSFAVGGTIRYWVTRIWSTALSYDFTNFTNESGSVKTEFDRHAVTFSVRATWQ